MGTKLSLRGEPWKFDRARDNQKLGMPSRARCKTMGRRFSTSANLSRTAPSSSLGLSPTSQTSFSPTSRPAHDQPIRRIPPSSICRATTRCLHRHVNSPPTRRCIQRSPAQAQHHKPVTIFCFAHIHISSTPHPAPECRNSIMSSSLALAFSTFLEHPVS